MKLRFDTDRLHTLLSLLPAVLLALVIGAELGWGQQDSLPAPTATAPGTDAVALTLRPDFALSSPEGAYTEISQRPLFVPNRRPPPPVAVEAARSAMIKGQFILVGVIQAGGSNNIAILREVASGKNRRVRQGKEINGLKLAKVEAKKVTLTQGGDSEELSIKTVSAQKSQLQTAQPGAGTTPDQQANSPASGHPVIPVNPDHSGTPPPALRRPAMSYRPGPTPSMAPPPPPGPQ